MPFNIPNLGSVDYPPQAEWDSRDISSLISSISGSGVYPSGCWVHQTLAQGNPASLNITVASGTCMFYDATVGPTIQHFNPGTLTLTANNTSNGRFDCVYAHLGSSTYELRTGTPAVEPVFPAPTTPSSTTPEFSATPILLAAIYMPPNTTAIADLGSAAPGATVSYIYDRRIMLNPGIVGDASPIYNGYQSWNFDIAHSGTTYTLTSGSIYLYQVPYPQGGLINTVSIAWANPSGLILSGNNGVVVYGPFTSSTATGTAVGQLGISANMTATWSAYTSADNNAVKTVNLTSPSAVATSSVGQFVYVGVMMNGTSTGTIWGANAAGGMINAGSATYFRSCVYLTGQTTFPSTVRPSTAVSHTNPPIWIGLS